ncbi:MAG TPA: rhodanese-like domain-containing protein [Bacteroidales bacterium]|nr:rhodanese-like domain-containing protein [Bacteroidales bacterium]
MKEHFLNLGFEINGVLHLTGRQAIQCIEAGAVLLDIREDYEIAIKDFGLATKIECAYSQLDSLIHTLPAGLPLIVADCVGIHSKECIVKLLENGFQMTANLSGGIFDWERDGLPMRKMDEVMSGQCPCIIKTRTQT